MNIYLRVLRYIKPYRYKLFVIFLLTVIVFLITLIPPFLTKVLIDDILIERDASLLNLMLLGVLVIFIFGLLLDFLQDYLSSVMVSRINFDVSTQFFRHLQRLSLKFYHHRRSGELLYKLFSDTRTIQAWISTNLITIFFHIATLLVVGGLMIYMDWRLSCISFAIIFFHVLNIIYFRKPIIKYSRRLRKQNEVIYGNTSEYLAGIREIKAYTKEDEIISRFEKELDNIVKTGIKSRLINKFSGTVVSFTNNSWSLLILWCGGQEVIKGELTLGVLMAFLMLSGRIYPSVSGLTNLILGLQSDLVGIKRVYEILDTPPDIKDEEGAIILPSIKGKIQFKNVSFSYEGRQKILDGITFSIQPGEIIALVGRSGVGKTTLCNLIIRFYEPDSGVILIDGYDIKKVQLRSLRDQLAIVPQEPILFSGTIKENILLGRQNASDEEIQRAAEMANIYDFISSLPHSWDTQVGERGVRLSGGQKQRIAIARVFLRDPRILILDEATSFIDLESEFLIQESLRELMKDRTTLIIAHRLSTIRNADKNLVLDNGKIIEEGTHEDLLAMKGFYYQLYEQTARL
ncbi:MAG: ABC transporter ATP-binding protein [Spirochaetes bacterium]|nr:MAG: ABC transporter ATP-binding protein [Spirochaetota bacterium]